MSKILEESKDLSDRNGRSSRVKNNVIVDNDEQSINIGDMIRR